MGRAAAGAALPAPDNTALRLNSTDNLWEWGKGWDQAQTQQGASGARPGHAEPTNQSSGQHAVQR